MLPSAKDSLESCSQHVPQDDVEFAGVAERLEEQRQKSRQFLHDQRQRLNALDDELLQNLTLLQQQSSDWAAFQAELQRQHESLNGELQSLAERHQELEDRDRELQLRGEGLRQSRHHLAERIQRHRHRIHATRADEVSVVNDEITRLQQQIQQLEGLADEQRKANDQLSAGRDEQMELQKRLEAELNTARGALAEQRSEEKELRQQLARSRAVLNERAQQITDLRGELENVMRSQEQAAAQGPVVDLHEFMELRKERDELQEQVSALQQAQQRLADQGGSESDFQNLQRRFDLLVEKVRDLKNRNAELESELASWRGGSTQPHGTTFDWEQQKRQMLNQMDGHPPESEAAGASSDDAGVQTAGHPDLEEEREQLRTLQEEWHNKLRSAEVEISIERAENARLRSQLQEKMRELETKMKAIEKQSEKETGSGSKPRRRWMDRLGLSGDDD